MHERIIAENLEEFYVFSRGKSDPASRRVFHPPPQDDLSACVKALEAAGKASGEFAVDGISCLGCAWLIEELFSRQPGSIECRVSPASGRARLAWKTGECDVGGFARKLSAFGYHLTTADRAGSRRPGGDGAARRLGLCAAFAMNAMLFTLPGYLGMEPGDRLSAAMLPVTAACATASVVVGGSYFLQRAWSGLRARALHIDLPIALGILAAFSGSIAAVFFGRPEQAYFDFVSVFTFLMLAGRWLQEYAISVARERLQNRTFRPGPVRLIAEQTECNDAPPRQDHERIGVGTAYTLAAGGTVPTRSVLISGMAEFSLDWIDGEPEPRVYMSGALIPSGAGLIGPGESELRSVEAWEGSLLHQLTGVKSEAEGRLHASVERAIRWYLALVLVVAALGGLAWWAAGRLDLALHVFISVLVVSCPCALGIAIPLADQFAAAALRRRGVHVRDGSVWSRLEKIQIVAFDKTGTLTRDTLRVENPEALEPLRAEEIASLAMMTSASLHPVARCIREELGRHADAMVLEGARVIEVVGQGLELTCAGETWRLGRPAWAVRQTGIANEATGTLFSRNGNPICSLRLSERIRDDAPHALAEVLGAGREVVVLSGDNRERVGAIAASLGIDPYGVHASLTPEGKADWIRRQPSDAVLMIGDGGNDSLAFAAAACRGAPASDRGLLESRSDFFLTGDRLGGIASLFAAVDARLRCIRVLMRFTLIYNLTVVGLALAGWMNPLLAAVLMPLSSLTALLIVTAAFRRV